MLYEENTPPSFTLSAKGIDVLQVPPLGRGKQRILAPAPSQPQPQGSSQATPLSQQNSKSFLAQLLTTGKIDHSRGLQEQPWCPFMQNLAPEKLISEGPLTVLM